MHRKQWRLLVTATDPLLFSLLLQHVAGASTSLFPTKNVDTSDLNIGPTKTPEMWNGTSETSRGTAKLSVINPATNKRHYMLFDFVAGNHNPIIGLNGVLRMELITSNLENFEGVLALRTKKITKSEILPRHKSVFADRVGTQEGEAHLSMNESVSSVILPSHSIPAALRPRVKQELDRMERLSVFSFIDEYIE